MPQRDHYEVLGVRRDATPEELKSAFKRLAGLCHPDLNPGDPTAHERFKEINLAYQVLSDDGRRSMYDRFGHRAEEPGSPFGTNGPFPGGRIDISDLTIDGLLGDLLGVFGVGRGEKGDIKRELDVSFEEAAFGCEKTLRYDRVVACKVCRGSGAAAGTVADPCTACKGRGRLRTPQGLIPLAVERACPACRGTGRIPKTPCSNCRGSGLVKVDDSVRLVIAAGVESGAIQSVPGAGNVPRPDRPAGSLDVAIRVQSHPLFRREGDDLACALPVTFVQAALGGELEIQTLDGKGTLRVPSGTQPGTVLRVKGKGVPRRNGIGRGDLRVQVTVSVPTGLSDAQRRLLEQLGREFGENVQPPQKKTFMGKLRHLLG